MKEYRAYVFSLEGHIISREEFICANEQEARARAMAMVADKSIELWEGPRLIARFNPLELRD
jgi:hypothetical protein